MPLVFTIPFNIPVTATLVAEQLLADGSREFLVREDKCEKILKVSKDLFDEFSQAGISPGDTFEIMTVATLDAYGFHSRVIITKREARPVPEV